MSEVELIEWRMLILHSLMMKMTTDRAIGIPMLAEHVQDARLYITALRKSHFEDKEIDSDVWQFLSVPALRHLRVARALLAQLCQEHIRMNTAKESKNLILPPFLYDLNGLN